MQLDQAPARMTSTARALQADATRQAIREHPMRVLSLFAGIGGFDLGLQRTGGFETVAFCEIDLFCRRVLAKHWPGVPQYDDVRELTGARLAADGIAVDVVCGGFPCQPFSTASRGRRVAVSMWPEFLRIVEDIRPRYVIVENVQQQALADAAIDLRGEGYCSYVRRIGADDVGADHARGRWWLCAYTDEKSELHSAIDAEMARLPAVRGSVWGPENYRSAVRVPDGIPARVDDRRAVEALGNAVLPVIPFAIGRAILAAEQVAA